MIESRLLGLASVLGKTSKLPIKSSISPGQNIRITDKEFSLQQNAISHSSCYGFVENSSSDSPSFIFQAVSQMF